MTPVLASLQRFATMASRRSDVVVAAFLMLAIVMMIIPLPKGMIDVLIGVNMTFSLLVLVVAFYIKSPVEFSSLPPVILISTLFRLALSISITRLILVDADAGQIVQAFGEFVIAGNVVVGLVVFLIITVAQFVVITKGSERVAEVAARFSLDAMPGKQMAIDNDLRNGDIDKAEAGTRRRKLERESQLYGAMDGAMKFVKGDAIAGLVIVLINLVGGLLIGMVQRGMSFGEAGHAYSLLTVGDGLIAQIPALLVSVAAGTVVTRVTSDTDSDLGSEITSQLIAEPRALGLAAALAFLAGLIPGFPTLVFLALAGALGGAAFVIHRRRLAAERKPELEELPSSREEPEDVAFSEVASGSRYRVTTWVGAELSVAVPMQQFRQFVDRARHDLFHDLGVDPPAVELRIDRAAEPNRFRIDLEDVPVADGDIMVGHVLLRDDPVHLDLMNLPYVTGAPLLKRRQTVWVEAGHAPELSEAGVGFATPAEALAETLAQTLRKYAAHFIGIQETRELLSRMEGDYSDLVKEAQRVASLQKISDILRRLVEEDVPIRNLRSILEAIVEWGPREQDPVMLVEYVRTSLARQICYRHAEMNRVISAYVLARNVEDQIRASVRQTAIGSLLSLPEEIARPIISQIRNAYESSAGDVSPTVLVSMDIRRHLRNLLARNDIDLPVMSYQELAPEFSVQSLASIAIQPPQRRSEPLPQAAE
jgi:type III secretion protein V